MDPKTHRRGPADTNSGRFVKLLLVSLLLHLPLTPWAALLGLLTLWSPPTDEVAAPPITSIPVDLLDEEEPVPAPEPPKAPAVADGPGESVPIVPHPPKKPRPAKPTDAGVPDAEPPDAEPPDAGLPDAGLEAGSADGGVPLADAGPGRQASDAGLAAEAGVAEAAAKPIVDPAVAASVKRIADPNALVRVRIYTDKIRQHPLGARVGPLLASVYQWRDFFGPAGIDPIRDIDQMSIWGSQLRDTSNMGAILQHHLPPLRMRAAIDRLVRADQAGGEWLDAGVPSASAHADGAERRFVLANAETVVVVPPRQYAAALSAAGKAFHLSPSKGPEVALIYLATPWRAFLGLPVTVPQSIKWVRVRITPTAEGGVLAELEGEDEDPEKASEDAAYLTRTADALSQLNLGFLGSLLGQSSHRFVEHIGFSSEGKMIRGTASVTAAQLETALDLAGAFFTESGRRRPRPAPSAGP